MIRELREEVEKLRQMLEISGGAGAGGEGAGAGGLGSSSTREMTELQEKLRISESLMQEMTMTWEQRVKATERIHQVCVPPLSSLSPRFSLYYFFPFNLYVQKGGVSEHVRSIGPPSTRMQLSSICNLFLDTFFFPFNLYVQKGRVSEHVK